MEHPIEKAQTCLRPSPPSRLAMMNEGDEHEQERAQRLGAGVLVAMLVPSHPTECEVESTVARITSAVRDGDTLVLAVQLLVEAPGLPTPARGSIPLWVTPSSSPLEGDDCPAVRASIHITDASGNELWSEMYEHECRGNAGHYFDIATGSTSTSEEASSANCVMVDGECQAEFTVEITPHARRTPTSILRCWR